MLLVDTFEKSNLQERPNKQKINELTYKIRDKFYTKE